MKSYNLVKFHTENETDSIINYVFADLGYNSDLNFSYLNKSGF